LGRWNATPALCRNFVVSRETLPVVKLKNRYFAGVAGEGPEHTCSSTPAEPCSYICCPFLLLGCHKDFLLTRLIPVFFYWYRLDLYFGDIMRFGAALSVPPFFLRFSRSMRPENVIFLGTPTARYLFLFFFNHQRTF